MKSRKKKEILSPEQKEIINNTTLIIPDNDGEAALTIDLAKKIGLDVRVSNQPWGARLDKELKLNPDILTKARKNVWIFEMPSKELEAKLKKQGMNIEIIDHHQYQNEDRSQKLSSLEQFLKKVKLTDSQLQKLGFDAHFVHGVAINDRDYIYGLREEGYSEEEIKKIREFDIRAQIKKNYDTIVKRNEEIYNNRKIEKDVIVLESKEGENISLAIDKIVLENKHIIPKILNIKKKENGEISSISFTGPISIVKKLKEECNPSFGGSSVSDKKSDFVGWIKPTKDQIEQIEKNLDIQIR